MIGKTTLVLFLAYFEPTKILSLIITLMETAEKEQRQLSFISSSKLPSQL